MVIWLRKASGRDPCRWIRAPHRRNEVMIDTRVVVGRDAPLVRLIAVDIEPARVSTREGQNGLIRPQVGVLPVLSNVECEDLRLDRTGTVALRPRDKEPVKWDVISPRDTQELGGLWEVDRRTRTRSRIGVLWGSSRIERISTAMISGDAWLTL